MTALILINIKSDHYYSLLINISWTQKDLMFLYFSVKLLKTIYFLKPKWDNDDDLFNIINWSVSDIVTHLFLTIWKKREADILEVQIVISYPPKCFSGCLIIVQERAEISTDTSKMKSSGFNFWSRSLNFTHFLNVHRLKKNFMSWVNM